jgi:hypothetical protein
MVIVCSTALLAEYAYIMTVGGMIISYEGQKFMKLSELSLNSSYQRA